ncbi:TPA: hypothetical protein LNF09_000133 [Enterococcus faecium]|nr:hypothetical protein [Enterococcus faecium]
MRATNDPKGNTQGGAQDFHDKRWYLNIPQRCQQTFRRSERFEIWHES